MLCALDPLRVGGVSASHSLHYLSGLRTSPAPLTWPVRPNEFDAPTLVEMFSKFLVCLENSFLFWKAEDTINGSSVLNLFLASKEELAVNMKVILTLEEEITT